MHRGVKWVGQHLQNSTFFESGTTVTCEKRDVRGENARRRKVDSPEGEREKGVIVTCALKHSDEVSFCVSNDSRLRSQRGRGGGGGEKKREGRQISLGK